MFLLHGAVCLKCLSLWFHSVIIPYRIELSSSLTPQRILPETHSLRFSSVEKFSLIGSNYYFSHACQFTASLFTLVTLPFYFQVGRDCLFCSSWSTRWLCMQTSWQHMNNGTQWICMKKNKYLTSRPYLPCCRHLLILKKKKISVSPGFTNNILLLGSSVSFFISLDWYEL